MGSQPVGIWAIKNLFIYLFIVPIPGSKSKSTGSSVRRSHRRLGDAVWETQRDSGDFTAILSVVGADGSSALRGGHVRDRLRRWTLLRYRGYCQSGRKLETEKHNNIVENSPC